MKALLICPASRPTLTSLAEVMPLGLVPVLGKSLVEYWLEHLATLGARQVAVLVVDRPEEVRARIGDGARWGLQVDVHPEIQELTPEQARAKYHPASEPGWLAEPNDAVVADHLPQLPQQPLLTGLADWFAALLAWMPHAATPDRIGVREIQPGVWCGLHTRVSPRAQLRAPVWLGEHVWIGPGAVVGPEAVVEDRVFVDASAEIAHSLVGSETYVGRLARLHDSLVWANVLIDWRTGSSSLVPDAFLLGGWGDRQRTSKVVGFLGRAAAGLVMAATAPLATGAMARALLRGQPVFQTRLAVRPRVAATRGGRVPFVFYELPHAGRGLRRWPQLWNIARGEFAWVGNRPLSPAEAGRLANDFERLWLAAPIGLISLADAAGCPDPFGDEARAHASFYAARAHWRLNWRIAFRAGLALMRGSLRPVERRDYAMALRPLAEEEG